MSEDPTHDDRREDPVVRRDDESAGQFASRMRRDRHDHAEEYIAIHDAAVDVAKDEVLLAVVALDKSQKSQYDALASTSQSLHGAVKDLVKRFDRHEKRNDDCHREMADRELEHHQAVLSAIRMSREGAGAMRGELNTHANEVELAKARAEAAAIVADIAKKTAVETKKSASGWRIAWTVALLVGGVLGGALKDQIIAAIARALGAH